MTIDAWVTLAVVGGLVVVLVRELVLPAYAVLTATILLLLLGVTTPGQAFSGFSNEAPIVVACILILARAVDIAGVVQPAVDAVMGTGRGVLRMARLVVPVAGFSAFLNNTAVVAMAVPAILDLAQRRGISPSRFLIPLSFAAVLGGVVTTIGTSTNLTMRGLLTQAGHPPLELFELTAVGLPIALAGCIVLAVLAERLLPDRPGTLSDSVDVGRGYTVAMRVVRDGPVADKSVEEAGLRHLQGVFLVEIERGGRLIAPVAPDQVLQGDDLLTFVGRIDQVIDLQRLRGLESAESPQIGQLAGSTHAFYEVVVGGDPELLGRTLREIGFRGRYGGAVLAIHRAGQRLDAKLGEVPLRLGDTLLILADPGFGDRYRDSRDFLLVAPLRGISPTQPRKAGLVAVVLLGFLVLAGIGIVPILHGALGVALLLIATRVLTLRQARDAVDLNIVILIAAAFGVGAAVQESGLAMSVAGLLTATAAPLGVLGLLAAVLVVTMATTELVSNNAAAVLLFPVALAVAAGAGADPRPFVIAVTLGASLSFLTPIGYQTNLLVYGLGGYRFTDFARVGLPLNLVTVVLALTLIPIFFPF